MATPNAFSLFVGRNLSSRARRTPASFLRALFLAQTGLILGGLMLGLGAPVAYAQGSGICDRTAPVQTAIQFALVGLGVRGSGITFIPCDEVTNAHLAMIEDLSGTPREVVARIEGYRGSNASGPNVLQRIYSDVQTYIRIERTSQIPRSSDFAGLTNLRKLRLFIPTLTRNHNNNVAEVNTYISGVTLPAGLFSEVQDTLEELNLSELGLTEINPAVFAGLGELRKLDLSRNRLTSLPADAFADLAKLEQLDFLGATSVANGAPGRVLKLVGAREQPNGAPPTAAYERIDERALGYNNDLETLAPTALSGLGNLKSLLFPLLADFSLPEGIFVGLSSLDELVLPIGAKVDIDFEFSFSLPHTFQRGGPQRVAEALHLVVKQGAPYDMLIGLEQENARIFGPLLPAQRRPDLSPEELAELNPEFTAKNFESATDVNTFFIRKGETQSTMFVVSDYTRTRVMSLAFPGGAPADMTITPMSLNGNFFPASRDVTAGDAMVHFVVTRTTPNRSLDVRLTLDAAPGSDLSINLAAENAHLTATEVTIPSGETESPQFSVIEQLPRPSIWVAFAGAADRDPATRSLPAQRCTNPRLKTCYVNANQTGANAPQSGLFRLPERLGFTLDPGTVVLNSRPAEDGIYDIGETIRIEVFYDREINPQDFPARGPDSDTRLRLDIGSKQREAYLVAVEGRKLIFEYTVQADDYDADGITVARNALSLNGAFSYALIAPENTYLPSLHENVAVIRHALPMDSTSIALTDTKDGSSTRRPSFVLSVGEKISFRVELREAIAIDEDGVPVIGVPTYRFHLLSESDCGSYLCHVYKEGDGGEMEFVGVKRNSSPREAKFVSAEMGTPPTLHFEYTVQANDFRRAGERLYQETRGSPAMTFLYSWDAEEDKLYWPLLDVDSTLGYSLSLSAPDDLPEEQTVAARLTQQVTGSRYGLSFAQPDVSIRAGASGEVRVERPAGFDANPVTVTLQTPTGWRAPDVVIPAGANSATAVISPSPEAWTDSGSDDSYPVWALVTEANQMAAEAIVTSVQMTVTVQQRRVVVSFSADSLRAQRNERTAFEMQVDPPLWPSETLMVNLSRDGGAVTFHPQSISFTSSAATRRFALTPLPGASETGDISMTQVGTPLRGTNVDIDVSDVLPLTVFEQAGVRLRVKTFLEGALE